MSMFKRGGVVLLLLAAACGLPAGPDSTSTPAGLDGTWVGTTSDNLVPAGNIRLTMVQASASLSGTWVSTSTNTTSGGMLSGSVNGTSVLATLTPSTSASCPLSVTATVTGTQMSGTYTAVNCTAAVTGSITLTKQ
jgi:hypothetical protein